MTFDSLQVTKESGACCWGAGLIAMDIIDLNNSEFAAAGGSCGNVMAILSWFGWAATPVARLGSDAAAGCIRTEFEELNVVTQYLSCELNVDTPIIIQRFATDKNGYRVHRFSLTCPECGAWLPRHRPITLKQANALGASAHRPKAYFFDRVSPGSIQLAQIARERGALVVFEPASVGDEKKFQRAVDLCHVLKYAQNQLGHLPDLAMTQSPKLVVETLGQDGLRFRWQNRWAHLQAIKVNHLTDAAGSGDWCTAALIHRIGRHGAAGLNKLRKDVLVTALRTGQALASINCQYYGARGAMMVLTLRQVNQRLKKLHDWQYEHSVDESRTPIGSQPPDFCCRCDTKESAGLQATSNRQPA